MSYTYRLPGPGGSRRDSSIRRSDDAVPRVFHGEKDEVVVGACEAGVHHAARRVQDPAAGSEDAIAVDIAHHHSTQNVVELFVRMRMGFGARTGGLVTQRADHVPASKYRAHR
jgi:hypothetical protein